MDEEKVIVEDGAEVVEEAPEIVVETEANQTEVVDEDPKEVPEE